MNKRESKKTVIAAMRRVLEGGLYLSPAVADSILSGLRLESTAAARPDGVLSARELELFELLGTGYKPAEIAAQMRMSIRTYRLTWPA